MVRLAGQAGGPPPAPPLLYLPWQAAVLTPRHLLSLLQDIRKFFNAKPGSGSGGAAKPAGAAKNDDGEAADGKGSPERFAAP